MNTTPHKNKTSNWLLIVILIAFFIFTISLNFDITEFVQRKEINIPGWYFIYLFSIDAIFLLSLVLLYFHRKIGTFLYPASVLAHFIIKNYLLNTFLYFDIFLLFFFFVGILLVVIPKWDSFK